MGFRRAKSTQGNTNCQKNIFEDDQVPGHHPRALKKKFSLAKQTTEYYRKRGSVSYIVREVHSVREREREIQREKDGSDVTIVALKLAMSFARLFAKNVHLSIGDEFCAFLAKKIAPQFLPS